MTNFLKKIFGDPVFDCVVILLILQVDWEWTNIKSFLTGGVIACTATLRAMR